jgi:hypothetical protein
MSHRATAVDLRPRLFYLIRAQDVELAEDFVRRCPEVYDLTALNAFFHRTLTQYQESTTAMRACLDDTLDMDAWLRMFTSSVLPYLRRHRFPPCTDRNASPFYQMLNFGSGRESFASGAVPA